MSRGGHFTMDGDWIPNGFTRNVDGDLVPLGYGMTASGEAMEEEVPPSYMFTEEQLQYLRHCDIAELLTSSDSSIRELTLIVKAKLEGKEPPVY